MKREEMIQMSRPESRHPKMRRQDRAKIFAPFAALSGHEMAVRARDQAKARQENEYTACPEEEGMV